MVKNIKLKTFFFKEYAQIAEKNTYSAYVPSGNGGIWCIADYDEKTEISDLKGTQNFKKSENVEKVNFARAGVQKAVEKYFENSDFSAENVEKIMEFSKDKVVFEKLKFQKFYKNEKNLKFENLYSQIIAMIDKNNLIVGNMGKTALVIYRENNILEKIRGETVKKIKLEKNDYLLVGSPEFWKIINENEISEIYIDGKSKENIEKNLSGQVKAVEEKLGKVIPFLSIFVENIEVEKNYELLEKEINEKNKKREISVKYMFLAVMFAFMSVSVGKNIQRENLKTEKNTDIKDVMVKKIEEKSDLLKTSLILKSEIEKNKIGLGNGGTIENKVENTNENVVVIEKEKVKNKDVENLETVQNFEMNKAENTKKVSRQGRKNEKHNRKNLNVNNRSFKKNYKLKNDKISQLEREIQRNWEILGRDKNGNDFG